MPAAYEEQSVAQRRKQPRNEARTRKSVHNTMAPIATTNGQMENPVGVAENGGECEELSGI